MTTTPLDRRGRWLLAVAAAVGFCYCGFFALAILDLSGLLDLWWIAVVVAPIGIVLGMLILRNEWRAEGGREAKLELDRWIAARRLPDDVPAGQAVSRLVKRDERVRGPVLTGLLAVTWTLILGCQIISPSRPPDVVGVAFRLVAMGGFYVSFVRALIFSRRQRRVIASLIVDGKRRLAEPQSAVEAEK